MINTYIKGRMHVELFPSDLENGVLQVLDSGEIEINMLNGEFLKTHAKCDFDRAVAVTFNCYGEIFTIKSED